MTAKAKKGALGLYTYRLTDIIFEEERHLVYLLISFPDQNTDPLSGEGKYIENKYVGQISAERITFEQKVRYMVHGTGLFTDSKKYKKTTCNNSTYRT